MRTNVSVEVYNLNPLASGEVRTARYDYPEAHAVSDGGSLTIRFTHPDRAGEERGWPMARVASWQQTLVADPAEAEPELGSVPVLPSREDAPRVGDAGYRSRGQGTLPDR